MKIYLILFIFFASFQLSLLSQPEYPDTWFQINDGFSKCVDNIGETGGYATWYRDNFDVTELIYKQGEMYAWINFIVPDPSHANNYSTDSLGNKHPEFNPISCASGLFRHDMVENKWYRASKSYPSAYGYVDLLTNGTDIIGLSNYGNIFLLDESQSNGWRQLTTTGFKNKDFYRLFGDNNGVNWGNIREKAFIGDTLFILILDRTHPEQQGVMKWNYKTNTLTFDSIGDFPCQLYPGVEGVNSDCDHFMSFRFADHIAGRFYLFAHYRDGLDKDSCWNLTTRHGEYNTVRVLWTWDPIRKKWFNISQGPDWRNLTPSNCTGDGTWYPSWDKKKIFITVQQGIYEWRGDSWELKVVGGSYNVGPIIPVYDPDDPLGNVTFYTTSRAGVELIDYANRIALGDGPADCIHEAVKYVSTPDNGKTLYLNLDAGMKYPKCTWQGNWGADLGIYWLQPDPGKVATTVNLHLEGGTYIGGDNGDNSAVGVGVGEHHRVFVAGNFASNIQGNSRASGVWKGELNGASPTDRGKVIGMNTFGDTIYSILTLGSTIYDYEIQNFGDFRMVISGNWGVTVIDSSGRNEFWTKTQAQLTADGLYGSNTDVIICDIDDKGHVVVERGDTESGSRNGTVFRPKAGFIVYDQHGNKLSANTSVTGDKGIMDITINNDTVFAIWQVQANFAIDPTAAMPECKDAGGYAGQPIQQPVLRAYILDGPTNPMVKIWQTWAFPEYELYHDMADAMPRKVNVGKDGKVYFLGEAAGGNSVYRWNGKMTPSKSYAETGVCKAPNTLKSFDFYNSPYNTGSAHLAYFCTVDPKTGTVERGQYIIPRLSTGKSNSFSLKNGYVHADQKGFVYVTGSSAYALMGRDMIHVNGKLLGNYAGGDLSIVIMNPEYTARTFWGAFNKDNYAKGTIHSIGIRDNIIAAFGSTNMGKLFTGASRYDPNVEDMVWRTDWAMNPDPFNYATSGSDPKASVNDAWLGVWYQDVWNRSNLDTMQPRKYVSQPVMPEDCFKNRVEFIADKTEVCAYDGTDNPNAVATITDYSIGDSTGWKWDFGTDASYLPGTLGEGPWLVYWTSPGLKTIFMEMIDSCGNRQYLEKYNYINVLEANLELDTLTGPSSVCEGSRAFFGTSDVYGIDRYVWTIPPGSAIVKGDGTSKIEVIFGNTPGTVSVEGEYACGKTKKLSKFVNIVASSEDKVLLVVGEDAPLISSDAKIKQKLEDLSYIPWVRDDDEVITNDHQCVNTVILSGSADKNKVGYKFRDVNTAVIVLNASLMSSMGLVKEQEGVDYGKVSGQQLYVKNKQHDLRYGLSDGNLSIYTSAGTDQLMFAVNCGSTSSYFSSTEGITYGADAYYSGGSVKSTTTAIDNTLDDPLYQSSRKMQDKTYDFTVPNGFYEVTLKFVNIDNTGDYTNIAIEGVTKLASFSVRKAVGINYALDYIYNVQVSDGKLTIKAGRIANDNMQIAGIKVVKINSAKINYGKPNESAISVATLPADTSKISVFGYEVGTKLFGEWNDSVIVPERRVGIYIDVFGPNFWTGDGEQLFENAMCWSNYNCPYTPDSIRIVDNITSMCPGRRVKVYFNATGNFLSGNKYYAQLSNAFGSFTSYTKIGELASSDTGLLFVDAKLPDDLLEGTKYRIRVVSSKPTIQSDATSDISLLGSAPKPGLITGPDKVCKFSTIATYTVETVPGATGYLWEIPLGTHFVEPNATNKTGVIDDHEVTIDFGTGTTNPIVVRSVNTCDTSSAINGYSSLVVSMTQFPAKTPQAMSGKDTVCQRFLGNYIMAPSPDAVAYGWIIPAPVTIIGNSTSNNVKLYFGSCPDKSEYEIKGYAIGSCGNSDTLVKKIRVDNDATKPKAGTIKETPGSCAGEYLYEVSPVVGAIGYYWTLPSGAEGFSATNQIWVTYTKNTTGQVSVQIEDSCGLSNVSSLAVSHSISGKVVMFQVSSTSSLSTEEQNILKRLRDTLHYTVNVVQENSSIGSELNCTDLIVISPRIQTNVNNTLKNPSVPILVMSKTSDHGSSSSSAMELVDDAWYNGPNTAWAEKGKTIYITDNTHDITYGLPLGNVQVFKTDEWITRYQKLSSAKMLARDVLGNNSSTIMAIEKNDLIDDSQTANERRAVLFFGNYRDWSPGQPDFATEVTRQGLKIFDQAVCWVQDNCNFTSVITAAIADNSYCPGEGIAVSYTAKGTFVPGNKFIAQLSDKNGSFSTPVNLSGAVNSVSSGTINAIIPINTPSGTNYKVRVISTNPVVSDMVVSPTSLTVYPFPVLSLTDTGICEGDTVILHAGTFNSYKWNNNATSSSISTDTSGLWKVTVTDNNGCVAQDSVMVTMHHVASFDIGNDVLACSGDSVTLDAGAGWLDYRWSNGDTVQQMLVFSPGKYSVFVDVTDANGCKSSDSVLVTIDSVLQVNLGNDTTLCIGNTLSLDAGNGFTAYLWNTNQTTQSIQVSNAGVYSVEVTSSGGCKGADSIQIFYFPMNYVQLGSDLDICKGDTVLLDAGSSFISFKWNNNDTSQSRIVFNSGSYSVEATDSNNCIAKDTIKISVHDLPMVALPDEYTICGGRDTVIQASSGYSLYSWKGMAGIIKEGQDPFVKLNSTGSYTLKITDQYGCTNADNFTIQVLASPVATILEADPLQVCPGQLFELNARGGDLYKWSNGKTDSTIQELVIFPQNYLVTVTKDYGIKRCSSVDKINISLHNIPYPNFIQYHDSIATNQQEVVFEVFPNVNETYSWSLSGAMITTDSSGTTSISTNWPGDTAIHPVISLTIIDTISTCSNVVLIPVTIYIPDPLSIKDSIVRDVTCFGYANGSVEVSIQGGITRQYHYQWSNGEKQSVIQQLSPGYYSLTAMEKGFDTITAYFVINQPDKLEVEVIVDQDIVCPGQVAEMKAMVRGGVGNNKYIWDSKEAVADYTTPLPGEHSLVVYDNNNCADSTIVTLNFPDTIKVNEVVEYPYCKERYDGSIFLEIANGEEYVYQWSNGENTAEIIDLAEGDYHYTVSDKNNCSITDTISLIASHNICVDIYTAFSPNSDDCNDVWRIPNISLYYPKVEIYIFDRMGQEVYSVKHKDPVWDGTLNGNPLPIETYHVVIFFNDELPPYQGQITILR